MDATSKPPSMPPSAARAKPRPGSEYSDNVILDALSAQVAILDETGTIIWVNRAWRDFAESKGPAATNVFEGANYLQVCDAADGPFAQDAAAIAAGIRAVMREQQPSFVLEHSCRSSQEKRWFIARVTRFHSEGSVRIVVTHDDVSDRKNAEIACKGRRVKIPLNL